MIVFDKVDYMYPDGTQVLHEVSFHVEKGSSVGLIGANGAGKSTLLKAALGLISAKGGITVAGLPMTRENLPAIRKAVGYVLQDSDNQMFMPKVLDDMIFGPMNYGASREDAEAAAQEVLASLGIEELKDRYNHKISGGEKRMAAIATILTMKPEAMLLDEPSSSLDPYNRRRLIGILNGLDVTKVIASHDLDLVLDTCDKVILLSEGRIVADGDADIILRDKELLEANRLELPFRLQ